MAGFLMRLAVFSISISIDINYYWYQDCCYCYCDCDLYHHSHYHSRPPQAKTGETLKMQVFKMGDDTERGEANRSYALFIWQTVTCVLFLVLKLH